MKDILLLVVRVLIAGSFVAGFAMFGDTLKPKMLCFLVAAVYEREPATP